MATTPTTPRAHRRAVKAYRRRHHALGLCLRCSAPAEPQGFCARHLERRRREEKVRRRRRLERRLAAGVCVRCGRARAPRSRRLCEGHLRSAALAAHRAYLRRLLAGTCTECNSPDISRTSLYLCERCRLRSRAAARRREEARRK